MNIESDATQDTHPQTSTRTLPFTEEPKTRPWTDTLLDTMRAIAREEVAKALTERENPQSVKETHNNG